IGQMSARIARNQGAATVLGVDLVPERLEIAARHGVEPVDLREVDDLGRHLRARTDGRGPDAVIDAVGMEAHGSPVGKLAHQMVSLLPDAVAAKMMETAGVDRLNALHLAIELARRGGTISLVGVYGGQADPLPMLTMFDKQIQLRMGQANVRRWVDDILPLLTDDDPLGVDTFATHHLPLDEGPRAYETFQKKQDGAVKILLQP
ncbi:MAG TPA: zinc-binding dehydrogenase, partial [Actinomycetota bacterium]|nr:zinc-binding dehydrogenase [Actinomycetota bacterium]